MADIYSVIAKLAGLDLSKYPCDEIKTLFGQMGQVGAIMTTLHPGKTIMRARPNYNGERFSKVGEISFKPAEFNKTFQRASTPNNTMFYGATVAENLNPEELKNTRIIGALEALPILRDPESSCEQLITYSKWVVTKDIPLVSIIHHKKFSKENSYAKEQREAFDEFIKVHPEEVVKKTITITEFLAEQYAKEVTPKDYDYLISALYAEVIAQNHAAGVVYPSVRTGGEGFNVAIHPTYVLNCMVPEVVGECRIYKKKMHTVVDNETIATLTKGQNAFELKPVEAEYHIGREKVMKMLGEGK